LSRDAIPEPAPWAAAVLVDEDDAGVLEPFVTRAVGVHQSDGVVNLIVAACSRCDLSTEKYLKALH
jgi:hypothetical protein